jgi:hypothetical protein
MARNNRKISQTDLYFLTTGKLEDGGYISKPQFPFLKYHKDTWRKKAFFHEFMREYNNEDEEAYMHVLKKVWCEHNTTCRKERKMLNPEILLDKCTDNCPCCDSKLWYGRCDNSIEEAKSQDSQPSIDRIDPNEGYTDVNTWIICTPCNRMKSNAEGPDRLQLLVNAWKVAAADKEIAKKTELRGPLDNF